MQPLRHNPFAAPPKLPPRVDVVDGVVTSADPLMVLATGDSEPHPATGPASPVGTRGNVLATGRRRVWLPASAAGQEAAEQPAAPRTVALRIPVELAATQKTDFVQYEVIELADYGFTAPPVVLAQLGEHSVPASDASATWVRPESVTRDRVSIEMRTTRARQAGTAVLNVLLMEASNAN